MRKLKKKNKKNPPKKPSKSVRNSVDTFKQVPLLNMDPRTTYLHQGGRLPWGTVIPGREKPVRAYPRKDKTLCI